MNRKKTVIIPVFLLLLSLASTQPLKSGWFEELATDIVRFTNHPLYSLYEPKLNDPQLIGLCALSTGLSFYGGYVIHKQLNDNPTLANWKEKLRHFFCKTGKTLLGSCLVVGGVASLFFGRELLAIKAIIARNGFEIFLRQAHSFR